MLKKFFLLQYRKNVWELFRLFFILFLAVFWFIFSDNIIKNANLLIQSETRDIIGWDISIEWNIPFSPQLEEKIQNYENTYSIQATKKIDLDTSIADKNGNPALVDVEFVESEYPLVWELAYNLIDASWTIYVDETLMRDFVINNSLLISWKKYVVKWVMKENSWIWFSFFTEGRKVIIPYESAQDSWLLTLWSRVQYEYLLLLPPKNTAFLPKFAEDKELFSWYQIRDYKTSVAQVSESIGEFDLVIKMFFVFAFFISIICIFLTIESYITLEKKNFSLMIIFGFSQWRLLLSFFIFLFSIFHIAFFFAYILNRWVLALFHFYPLSSSFILFPDSIALGYIVWVIILILWSFYSLFSLLSLKPLESLRPWSKFFTKKDILIQWGIITFWIVLFFLFSFWISGLAFLLSFLFLVSLLAFIFLFHLIFVFLYKQVRKYKKKYFLLFDIVRFSVRPGNMTLVTVIPLFITFLLLFVFTSFTLSFLSKTSSLEWWNDTFIINIPEALKSKVSSLLWAEEPFDIILWRIRSINSQSLALHLGVENPSREFTREFNTTTHPLPKATYTIWKHPQIWEVSLDEDFAKRIKLSLWDRVTFNFYGKEKSFIVSSFRLSLRDGFNPFFYFQFHPDDFVWLPRNYFLATRLEGISINDLRKEIYNLWGTQINVIDLKTTLEKIENILTTIIKFTFFLLAYIIAYNLIILSVSLNFLSGLRKNLSFLYHILWASEKFIRYHLFFEYVYIISLASIFSFSLWILWYSFLVWRSNFINFDIIVLFKTYALMFVFFCFILTFVALWKHTYTKK
jgi:putative ABC transport system permease protein